MATLTPQLVDLWAWEQLQVRQRDPWRQTAHAAQLPPPGSWRTWLFLAGRGAGKTRAAAEWVRAEVMANRARRIALVAPTAADARDVMVQGESGLLAVCARSGVVADYQPSLRRVDFPNGAFAMLYSAEEPLRLHGPQHDLAWCDELAMWRFGKEAWDALQFTMRIGDPRQVVTTTPRRVPLLRHLLADGSGAVAVTRATTYDNRANLAPAFLAQIVARYEGTTLGRQELHGELLDEVEGAHWSHALIEATRVTPADVPPLRRVVVGVDPQGQAGIGSETGIVAAGVGRPEGAEADHAYVLADASVDASPHGWARAVLACYQRHQADRIVAEVNFGGQMVESTLRTVDPSAPVSMVSASRGKLVRAEPVAALFEQGRGHLVGGFPKLEDELTGYDGTGPSPNRMDSMVWSIHGLGLLAPVVVAGVF